MPVVRLNTPKYDDMSIVEGKRQSKYILLKIWRTLFPTICRIPLLYLATTWTTSYNFNAVQPVSYLGLWNGFNSVQGTCKHCCWSGMIFRIRIRILLFSWFRDPTWVFSNILNINFTFIFPRCKCVRLHIMRYKLFILFFIIRNLYF